MVRPPKTPFPFPDLPSGHRPWPREIPLEITIWQLSGWWLDLQCECGRNTPYPSRLLAAEFGWHIKLGEIIPRMKCKTCGRRPATVSIIETVGGEGRHGAPEPRRLVIKTSK